LLEASKKRGLTIVPISVGASQLYARIPSLAALQFANDPKRPLNGMTEADWDATLATVADSIGRVLDTERVSNPLRAMDAVAFQAMGFGGTASARGGVAAMGSHSSVTEKSVVLTTREGVTRTIIKWQELSVLPEEARQLIRAFDHAIRDLFDRWTETWPRQASRDPEVKQRAIAELTQIRKDMCDQFNALLDFFAASGWSLDDHYYGVRFICSQPPIG